MSRSEKSQERRFLRVKDRLTLRVSEVAQQTGLAKSSVHDLLRRGELEVIRVPGIGGRRATVLIPVRALEEFLERHRQPARAAK